MQGKITKLVTIAVLAVVLLTGFTSAECSPTTLLNCLRFDDQNNPTKEECRTFVDCIEDCASDDSSGAAFDQVKQACDKLSGSASTLGRADHILVITVLSFFLVKYLQ